MALFNRLRSPFWGINPSAAYAATLAVCVAALATTLLAASFPFPNWPLVGGLALVGLLAERGRVVIANRLQASIAMLPMLFAAVLLGPLPAMAVGVASVLGDFTTPYLRFVAFASI